MSDIEDEVKCSECPNARHGFDRNASHNAGRYVCECESHECPSESLRQQLADSEAERLEQARLLGMSGEREAKLLTQLAAAQAREQQLREAIRDVCCDPDGNVCIGLMGGCYADKEVLEEALALPQDTSALEAMIVKAGEVMRERCFYQEMELANCEDNATHYRFAAEQCAERTRAIPGVTLEDLK